MARVLEGIRVIELGTFITGPYAAMLLTDLGADVIKVEQPGGGDLFRGYQGSLYGPHFSTYNARKRSLALNLKSPHAKTIFERLAQQAVDFTRINNKCLLMRVKSKGAGPDQLSGPWRQGDAALRSRQCGQERRDRHRQCGGSFYTNVLPEADALFLNTRTTFELRKNGGYDYINKL